MFDKEVNILLATSRLPRHRVEMGQEGGHLLRVARGHHLEQLGKPFQAQHWDRFTLVRGGRESGKGEEGEGEGREGGIEGGMEGEGERRMRKVG